MMAPDNMSEKSISHAVLPRFSFVTVTQQLEINLLLLQAKSLVKFAGRIASTWHVVWNENYKKKADHEPSLKRVEQELAGSQITLNVIWRRELIPFEDPHSSGHRMQQFLKLRVATVVSSEFYIILDTKNHAIRPLEVSDFVQAGKARSFYQHLAPESLFYASYTVARSIFKVMPGKGGKISGLPSTTPYVAPTRLVLDLLGKIEDMEPGIWQERILTKGEANFNVTEFSLISAYTESLGDLQERFSLDETRIAIGIFAVSPRTEEERLAFVRRARQNSAFKFFGLHQARLGKLSALEQEEIADLWEEAGLIEDRAVSLSFLSTGRLNLGS